MNKKIYTTLILLALLITGCAKNESQNAAEISTPNTLNHLAYCNVDDSKLCVEGFGKDSGSSLVILLKAKRLDDLQGIKVNVSREDETQVAFECYRSDDFVTDIYCTGKTLPASDEKIKIDIFDRNEKLLGSGYFSVQYGQITFPRTQASPLTGADNADYPNYPNTSNGPADYPNAPGSANTPDAPSYPSYPSYPN